MQIGERKFTTAFKSYCRTLKLAIKISRLGGGRYCKKNHVAWACVLFTKLCVTGNSLKKLLDHNLKVYQADWDYASAFSLTRNLMECHQTFFYLCCDDVSDDELKARKALFNIHDYYARKIFFSFMPDTGATEREDTEIERLVIDQLKATSYFQHLTEKQQKHYLSGKDAFFLSRETIEEKQGTSKDTFKLFYKFLSANIHSFPMGFFRMLDGERGAGVHTDIEEKYSAMALDISENYLIRGCLSMLEFFPDILNNMSLQEKKLIGIDFSS